MVEKRDKNKDSLNNAASCVHLSNSVPPIAKVKKPEKIANTRKKLRLKSKQFKTPCKKIAGKFLTFYCILFRLFTYYEQFYLNEGF